jgi:hypothetical protein
LEVCCYLKAGKNPRSCASGIGGDVCVGFE